MDYLYGDSTPSPLKSNFLEFFRDALDFSVFVLLADDRIKHQRSRIQGLREEADAEMARLEEFVGTVARAIEGAPKGAAGSATARCAEDLTSQSGDALRSALNAVREKLSREVADAEAAEAVEREACTRSLETLLAPHDPPDTSTITRVELGAGGAYDASQFGEAEFGLAWSFGLVIPDTHLWASPLRLERLFPAMEIRTPQTGWLGKAVKVRPQKIERHVVSELVDDGETVSIKLRAEPGAEVGFDLEVDPATKHVTIARVGAAGDASAGSFEVEAEDLPKLVDLAEKLRASAAELERRHLVEASVEGVDFHAQPTFTAFVERLVAMMAPIAREISERSLTPNEMVIRRLLANDRREEIFVAKSALRVKYAPLSDALRALFVPLGLDAQGTPKKASLPPTPPPPAVRSELAPSRPPPPMPKESKEPKEPKEIVTAVGMPVPPELKSDVAMSELARSEGKALVTTLKKIVALAKSGSTEEAYREYATLFSSAAFAENRPEDQRQALKLMIFKKPPPPVSDAVLEAHRAALVRVQALIDKHGEPADYELLGVSQVILNDTAAATNTFTTALAMERERNPQSELCGNLMRRVTSL